MGPRIQTKQLRLLALLATIMLAGCGRQAGTLSDDTAGSLTGSSESTAPALSFAGAESDASGTPFVDELLTACWPAGSRVASESEGENVAGKKYAQPPAMAIDPKKRYTATLETNKGMIEIEFLPGDAPNTVNNFVCLARDGYYDGTPFHRIVKGFVIQGGDPTGTGSGGPGYKFNDEAVTRSYTKGIVAMANSGANTNGSQFFIVLEDLTGKLPPNYTIFGKVIGGQETVALIAGVATKRGGDGANSSPIEPVILERATIQEG